MVIHTAAASASLELGYSNLVISTLRIWLCPVVPDQEDLGLAGPQPLLYESMRPGPALFSQGRFGNACHASGSRLDILIRGHGGLMS